jgi:hypothetical protein
LFYGGVTDGYDPDRVSKPWKNNIEKMEEFRDTVNFVLEINGIKDQNITEKIVYLAMTSLDDFSN